MPLPAGTGLTRRSFLARSLGLALTVYGAGSLGAFDGGIAEAARGAGGPILVSVFLPGGADGMSMLYPAGDPLYRSSAPASRSAAARSSARTTGSPGTPRSPRSPSSTARARSTVMPAIGYSHPDQSHFTSRHYWEVGATDADLQTGWMGRYLDAVGTADNPLQGLSLTGQLEPTLATATVPVAAISAPNQYTLLGARASGARVGDRMVETLGAFGRLATADPAARAAVEVAVESNRLRQQLLPFAKAEDHTRRSPTRRPPTPSRSSSPGLAAMIGAGLPMRCVALEASGEYDTHADQAAALSTALARDGRLAPRLPARPRGPRRRRPGADARLDGVRPSRAAERLGRHRPRRRRHRLPDRDARDRQDGRRVPGARPRARRRRQPAGRRPTSAASTPRCSSSG